MAWFQTRGKAAPVTLQVPPAQLPGVRRLTIEHSPYEKTTYFIREVERGEIWICVSHTAVMDVLVPKLDAGYIETLSRFLDDKAMEYGC